MTRRMDPTVRTRVVQAGLSTASRILVFSAGAVLFAGLVFAGRALLHRRNAQPSEVPVATAAASSAAAEIASASAVAPAASASSASASPPIATALPAFDRDGARVAMDAIAPKIADCKLPKGRVVQVRVTFAANGTTSLVTPVHPAAGSRAACVVAIVRDVKVAPFQGPPNTAMYSVNNPGH